ncbi:MAG: helicase C-terminal domain-containing protein [Rhabdochlamydiaceae bacterium]
MFHKLIYNPKIIGDFDVTIFDESHSLEDAVRNGRIAKIRRMDLERLQAFAGGEAGAFRESLQTMERISRLSREPVNPMVVERKFVNPIKALLSTIEENIRNSELTSRLDPSITEAYFTLSRSINSIDRLDSYRFVYHDDGILGIPSNIFFSSFNSKQISRNVSVALISATIESPKFHLKETGFPFYSLAPPVQIESARMIEDRFRKRPIFGLVDGPILRKDPNFRDSYDQARMEANEIIGSLVPNFTHPALILCRSGNDARSIKGHFASVTGVHRRIFLFEDEETKTELDVVERNLNEKISHGQDVIITTAASRLWEGVNLNQLRFLIIDALPYASPQPYDNLEKNAWSSWRNSRTFRFMIRRMQQGIGRLVRTDNDPWGIVVVIDGRFNAQWNTIRTALPSYITDTKIISFVTRNRIVQSVLEQTNRLEGKFSIK